MALTVQKASSIAAASSDELFELSIQAELEGNHKLADKLLQMACDRQAIEAYRQANAVPAPAPKPAEPVAEPVDDSQAYQDWLQANAEPTEPEPTDVEVEVVQATDFLHLTKHELQRMVKYLGIDTTKYSTRKELAQLLADAENGIEPKPAVSTPKPAVSTPKPAPQPKPVAPAKPAKPAPQPKPVAPAKPKTYRELQARCKELGLKANGSTDTLVERLSRHEAGIATSDDYTKSSKPKSTASKSTAKSKSTAPTGLSYRQAQRLVKWLRENVVAVPEGRNSGWGNIRLILVGTVGTEHYKAVMVQRRNQQELAKLLEVDASEVLHLINATATLEY